MARSNILTQRWHWCNVTWEMTRVTRMTCHQKPARFIFSNENKVSYVEWYYAWNWSFTMTQIRIEWMQTFLQCSNWSLESDTLNFNFQAVNRNVWQFFYFKTQIRRIPTFNSHKKVNFPLSQMISCAKVIFHLRIWDILGNVENCLGHFPLPTKWCGSK